MTQAQPKTAAEMMADVASNVSNLVRNEVDLARAELVESLKGAVTAIVMVLIALILAITGLNVLSATIVSAFVAAGMSPVWATLLTAALFIGVAVIMVMVAMSMFKRIGLVPRRMASNIQRDVAAATEAYNDK